MHEETRAWCQYAGGDGPRMSYTQHVHAARRYTQITSDDLMMTVTICSSAAAGDKRPLRPSATLVAVDYTVAVDCVYESSSLDKALA